MLLTIDVGNTNIVIGGFEGKKLTFFYRFSTPLKLTGDEAWILIKNFFDNNILKKIKDVIICSVVPSLNLALEEMSSRYLNKKPIFIDGEKNSGIKILYKDPSQVGADRIANAVAAFQLYGGPVIVVDLGTATTFDVVSDKGEYLGGAIAPGIETSTAELFKRAALLTKVELQKPQRAIGKTTRESLKAGIIYGACGQIDFIIEKIEEELKKKSKVVATGGLADLVFGISKKIKVLNKSLTLEGLRLIHQKMTSKK